MATHSEERKKLIEATKEAIASEEFPSRRQLAITVAKKLGLKDKTVQAHYSHGVLSMKWKNGKPNFTVHEDAPEPEVETPSTTSPKDGGKMTDKPDEKKLDEILKLLKTCSGEECELLKKQGADLIAALERNKVEVTDKVKAAIDSRLDSYAKRMEALEMKLGAPPQAPAPVAANPNPDVPEDYDYFRHECGKVVSPGTSPCPKCNEELDWGSIMAGYATQYLLAPAPAPPKPPEPVETATTSPVVAGK